MSTGSETPEELEHQGQDEDHMEDASESHTSVSDEDELSDNRLIQTLHDLQKNIKHLEIENYVLVNFLRKNDPTSMETMTHTIRYAQSMRHRGSCTSRRSTLVSLQSRAHSISGYNASINLNMVVERDLRINLSQRTDLVLRELEEIQMGLDDFSKKTEQKRHNLAAELEELNIRTSETQDAIDIFEQTVVDSTDKTTQRISAERFIRYMDEWLKSAQSTIDKIRLRTSALKVQYQKVSAQLTEKELLGENLHQIDFEKLEIENRRLSEEIDQKTELLFELKRMTGTANLALNNNKKLLRQQLTDLDQLNQEIEENENGTNELDEECYGIEAQVEAAKEKYNGIQTKMEMYDIPDVIEYVKIKAELNTVKKNIKIWERRTQIKEMALNSCLREIKHLTGENITRSSWLRAPSKLKTQSEIINFGASKQSITTAKVKIANST